MPCHALVCLFAFASFVAAAPAQEWTRFRGPNGTGESEAKTVPAEWTEKDYNWRVELPGVGHSSPVLWGDRIFLNSADPKSGARYLVCLKSGDGKQAWKKEFPASAHHVHVQNSFASSTPAVDKDHVYVAWATPQEYVVLALNHAGKEIWRVDLGPFSAQHGFGTSPIVYQDAVIIGNEQDGASFVIALNKDTGVTKWKTPRDTSKASYSTPCIYQPPDGPVELIFNSQSHGINSIDPSSGRQNWEAHVFERRPVSSPIIAAGLILGTCGEGSGNNAVIAVRPGDASGKKAEVAYKIDKTSAPYVPTLVAGSGLIFLWSDRGVVTAIDALTGKIQWRERVGGNFSGSPIRVADRLYCISADGDVVVLAAGPEYKLLAKNPLNETSRSTPAVADGRLYLRTQSHLVSVGGKKS